MLRPPGPTKSMPRQVGLPKLRRRSTELQAVRVGNRRPLRLLLQYRAHARAAFREQPTEITRRDRVRDHRAVALWEASSPDSLASVEPARLVRDRRARAGIRQRPRRLRPRVSLACPCQLRVPRVDAAGRASKRIAAMRRYPRVSQAPAKAARRCHRSRKREAYRKASGLWEPRPMLVQRSLEVTQRMTRGMHLAERTDPSRKRVACEPVQAGGRLVVNQVLMSCHRALVQAIWTRRLLPRLRRKQVKKSS